MSNPIPFPGAQNPAFGGFSSETAEKIVASIRAAFSALSPADQQRLVDELTKATRLIPASRAGDVLGTIVRFLPSRANWTAEEVRQRVASAGIQATSREIFNAIGYLARKGYIKRRGNGQYLICNVGMQTSDDFGGPSTRYEDD